MKRKEIIAGNEISEMITLPLNGFPQKVLIEGKKKSLPVLITLHGGPGQPLGFGCGSRGMLPAFTERFIMVYWDQLGCGINNHELDASFTIDSFVKMTEDLVTKVKEMFPLNKIYVFSMSWGSILSAGLLQKSPHAVDGVIAAGQVIRNVMLSDEIINRLEHSGISKRKMEKIRKVTRDNVTTDDVYLIAHALMKYTDGYSNKKGTKVHWGPMLKGVLTSPDYSFRDIVALLINGTTKNKSLWKEITLLDLSEALSRVEVPYLMLQGETDIVASTKTASELVAAADNPNLRIRVIKDTGHLPTVGMMKAFEQELDRLKSEIN